MLCGHEVPLGMKFAWSPKALLSAAFNDARFKKNDQVRVIYIARNLPEI